MFFPKSLERKNTLLAALVSDFKVCRGTGRQREIIRWLRFTLKFKKKLRKENSKSIHPHLVCSSMFQECRLGRKTENKINERKENG